MARPLTRTRVLECVKEYCQPVRDKPLTDDRDLSVQALIKIYKTPTSPQTWYTHGAGIILEETERLREARRAEAAQAAGEIARSAGAARRQRRNRRVVEARADARKWEQMYREVLARYTIVERYFQRHRHAGDLDAIIRAGLDRPNRDDPQ